MISGRVFGSNNLLLLNLKQPWAENRKVETETERQKRETLAQQSTGSSRRQRVFCRWIFIYNVTSCKVSITKTRYQSSLPSTFGQIEEINIENQTFSFHAVFQNNSVSIADQNVNHLIPEFCVLLSPKKSQYSTLKTTISTAYVNCAIATGKTWKYPIMQSQMIQLRSTCLC